MIYTMYNTAEQVETVRKDVNRNKVLLRHFWKTASIGAGHRRSQGVKWVHLHPSGR